MWLYATSTLEFQIPEETPFLLMLRPRSGWQQWISREQYLLTPNVPMMEFTDPFGNLCQRVVVPAGPLTIQTAVDAEVPDGCDTAPGAPFTEVQKLPNDTLPFLLPSRYCESDRFMNLAYQVTNEAAHGYDQCTAIVDYIRTAKAYGPGLGNDIISACEANQRSHLVCRDMAHIGIACCRALSIPARMVVGYLESLEPMDLHAWFEAYVGGRWYTFDPTQEDNSGGRIAIAYGRDAADVAIYTQFGPPVNLISMAVSVTRKSTPPSM
ncbi:transglutaminase domain-containing protein [Rubritalea sp.]|uniref:transglutaminase domain-containing protein n=1 Tax=Rubritalea sp. TaxID=2109375 RepID=UPI003EF82CAE